MTVAPSNDMPDWRWSPQTGTSPFDQGGHRAHPFAENGSPANVRAPHGRRLRPDGWEVLRLPGRSPRPSGRRVPSARRITGRCASTTANSNGSGTKTDEWHETSLLIGQPRPNPATAAIGGQPWVTASSSRLYGADEVSRPRAPLGLDRSRREELDDCGPVGRVSVHRVVLVPAQVQRLRLGGKRRQ
jgi:hypothetical protein